MSRRKGRRPLPFNRRNPSNPLSSNWNIPIPASSLEVPPEHHSLPSTRHPSSSSRNRRSVQSGQHVLHELSIASLVQLVRERGKGWEGREEREREMGNVFSVPLTSYFLDLTSLIVNNCQRRSTTSTTDSSPPKCNGRLAKSYLKLMQSMWIKPPNAKERSIPSSPSSLSHLDVLVLPSSIRVLSPPRSVRLTLRFVPTLNKSVPDVSFSLSLSDLFFFRMLKNSSDVSWMNYILNFVHRL